MAFYEVGVGPYDAGELVQTDVISYRGGHPENVPTVFRHAKL